MEEIPYFTYMLLSKVLGNDKKIWTFLKRQTKIRGNSKEEIIDVNKNIDTAIGRNELFF
jgi:hypothetical protein